MARASRLLALVALVGAVGGSAGAAASTSTSTSTSAAAVSPSTSGCRVLAATAALKATLLRVHRATITAAGSTTSGPVGRVHYGRCPKAFYALASFRHTTPQVDFGTQDQPERLRRPAGGRWQDRGDTGGDVCEAAPKALLRLWGLQQGCR